MMKGCLITSSEEYLGSITSWWFQPRVGVKIKNYLSCHHQVYHSQFRWARIPIGHVVFKIKGASLGLGLLQPSGSKNALEWSVDPQSSLPSLKWKPHNGHATWRFATTKNLAFDRDPDFMFFLNDGILIIVVVWKGSGILNKDPLNPACLMTGSLFHSICLIFPIKNSVGV